MPLPDSVEGLLCSIWRPVCDTKTHICLLKLRDVRALFKSWSWLSIMDLFLTAAQFTDTHPHPPPWVCHPDRENSLEAILALWLSRATARVLQQTRESVYLPYNTCIHSLLSIYFVCGVEPRRGCEQLPRAPWYVGEGGAHFEKAHL